MGRDLWFGTYESTSSCLYHSPQFKCRNKEQAQPSRLTLNLASRKLYPEQRSSTFWPKWSTMFPSVFFPLTAKITDLLLYGLVVTVCFGCYVNSLDGDFVHDDLVAVTTNPDVIGKNPTRDIFANDFWGKPMAHPSSHKSYRPLTILTFRLNYLFCGLSPWGYHLVNMVLHAAVCILVTYFCFEVLHWTKEDSVTASLMFATHPVHTEAVTSVVGRAELLSAFLFLVSLLCFTKSAENAAKREKWFSWLLLSLFCAGCALLAKEQGIAVLPVCIAWRILQPKKNMRSAQPNFLIRKGIYFLSDAIFWITLTMFALLLAFRLLILQGTMPKFSEEDNPASFCPSLLTRFFTYSYLAAFNGWLLLNPKTLSYDWQMGSVPLVTSAQDVRNAATLFLYAILLLLAARFVTCYFGPSSARKRSESNTLLLSIGVIVVPFLPASNLFVTVGFVVAERVLYVPSIGFCLLVTFGLKKLRRDGSRLVLLWKTLTFVVVVLFAVRTITRNQDWKTRETLFKSGLRSVPQNAKVHYNFANLQKDLGNVEAAIDHYKIALKLWPNHASAHNNLGTLLPSSEEAEQHFRAALIINPQHPRALFNLASLYSRQGRAKVAQELLQRALELDSEFTEAYTSLAAIHAEEGRHEEAEELHLKAITVDQNNADSYNNYGTFLQKFGRVEEAVQQYKEAIRLQPNHTVAIVNAARSLRSLKNNREAEMLYKRALTINPEAKIMDNLGVLYISAGRITEASRLYNDMQEKHLDYDEGKVHFAQVLMQKRSFQQAEQLLHSVIQKNSSHRDALHQLSLLYSQVNRTTEALENILKALNLCSSTDIACAQLHVDHADILKDMKQWDDAALSYKMAIELEPKLSHAHVNLAVINHLQGDCHQALRHYHEAYILDPGNQLLQDNMRKLKLHLVDESGTCQGSQAAICKSR